MDRRDRIAAMGTGEWPEGTTFDRRAKTATVCIDDDTDDGVTRTFRCQTAVCGTCDGKGAHVNPSVDADHGITSEEFNDDPDFRDAYFSGAYDVRCCECKGERVVLVLAESGNAVADVRWLREWRRAEERSQRERESEMRYGY